ncbi:polysaccharide deacetylase family protein [Spirosoma sp. BT702]|uniref:Polysaccharide deacetylase family protein n=2 Tax=Spirosoma profusum TaxID=2771354 RepID=A0A926Y0B1_9BACT|nr:polysaccharide deacetylase family protein [Spirosoma profusum]
MKKRLLILLAIVLLGSIGLWKLSRSRTYQVFGELYPRINTTEKVVALTFDDGPTPRTDSILTLLRDLDIKATFFVIGRDLVTYATEAPKILAAGHQLGNHTYSHERMVLKSYSFVKEEIEKTDSLIRKAGFQAEIVFRPPYGKRLFALPYYLKQTGRKTIMWDVEPESFSEIATDSAKITKHVLANTKPGSIILLHIMYDGKESIKAIPPIVRELKSRGFTFKTVTELLRYQLSQ